MADQLILGGRVRYMTGDIEFNNSAFDVDGLSYLLAVGYHW